MERQTVIVGRFGTELQQSSEGYLAIDLIHNSNNVMVWEDSAQNEATGKDRRDIAATFDRADRAIFREFPILYLEARREKPRSSGSR